MTRRSSVPDEIHDMKQIPFFCALSLAGLLACSTFAWTPVQADDDSSDFTYEVDSDTGEGYLTGYTGSATEITLPDTLDDVTITGISADAFYNCTTLEKVTISANITDIGESVFFGCENIKEFDVETGSETYYVEDGVLFRTTDDCLIAYPPAAEATSYTVPDTVTELYYAAFSNCNNLQEIILPDGLLYIDEWVFAYDTLPEISIPESVVEICDYAFAYCENITEWTLPSNLTYIGNAAFANCTGMTEIELPSAALTSVGQAAFVGTGLTEITIPSCVEEIGYCAFGYADMTTAVDGFKIYGESGSMAQTYASDTDDTYDYKNSFTFITVQDASQVRGGLEETLDGETEEISANTEEDADADTTTTTSQQSNSKKILLGISAVVLLVGAVLIVLGLRSGGKTDDKQKKEDKKEKEDKKDEEKKTDDDQQDKSSEESE